MVMVFYTVFLIYFFYAFMVSICKKSKVKACIDLAIFLCLICARFCTNLNIEIVLYAILYVILLIYFYCAFMFFISEKNKIKACVDVAMFLCLVYLGFCTIVIAHNIVWSLPGVENKSEHVYNCKICNILLK